MCFAQDKEQADEDLEAILAELDGKQAPAQASSTAETAAPAAPAANEDGSVAQPSEESGNTAVSTIHHITDTSTLLA